MVYKRHRRVYPDDPYRAGTDKSLDIPRDGSMGICYPVGTSNLYHFTYFVYILDNIFFQPSPFGQ
jgi:hypothetical protein